MDDGTVKKRLRESAYNGSWDEVVKIYSNTPSAHILRLDRAGHTALHIAISHENGEAVVECLVELAGKHNPGDSQGSAPALTMGDKQGNTPLHLAVAVGNASMCSCIAAKDGNLVGIPNKDGLNPIHVAVLCGRKDAFLALIHGRGPELCSEYACAGMKNGHTILHSAIRNEYMELAFIIAENFENLKSLEDEGGMSPLHVLATRPSCFKSGATLPDFFVEDVEPPPFDAIKKMWGDLQLREKSSACFQKIEQIIWTGSSNQPKPQGDVENPVEGQNKFCSDTGVHLLKAIADLFLSLLGAITKLFKFLFQVFNKRVDLLKVIAELFKFPFHVLNKVLIHAWIPQSTKKKHQWSIKVLDKLLEDKKIMKYLDEIYEGAQEEMEEKNQTGQGKGETPILIAAKNGITEMVYKILKKYPEAIEDTNSEGKNVVLLAVEHKQRNIYEHLRKTRTLNFKRAIVFGKVDNKGNSALHLAAKMGEAWNVPIAQLLWEIKWFKYIKHSMGSDFQFAPYNEDGKTARDILEETHKDLFPQADQWVDKLCKPCSVVAAVIAAAALTTSSNVPGGFDNGRAVLHEHSVFDMYSIASLVALCFSINSLVMFLCILVTQHQYTDFRERRPWKLLLGLASLFLSIVATVVYFFCGHYFVVDDVYDHWELLLVFAVTLLPTAVFIMQQLPVYLGILFGTALKQRRPRYR